MKVKVKLRLLELYDELKMELEENLTVRSLLKKLKDKSELILLLPLLQVDKSKKKKQEEKNGIRLLEQSLEN